MKKKIFNLPLVVIGVLLIIYISLGVVYLQKQDEFQSQGSQMSLQRTILQKPLPDVEKLRSQLKEAESEFAITVASLTSTQQGIDIYGVLVNLGRNSSAEIMSIAASPPIIAKVGNETILPYSLVVSGNQTDILDFISSLIRGEKLLEGLELKSIDIKNGTLSDNSSTLNLELYIHTWSDNTSGTIEVPRLSEVKK